MAHSADFAKLVPGFDFLENLVKNAGKALPGIGQWVAPTINPEELEKRIDELRTVQYWLEQNARMLGTTIQALEVQRMTLSTLKTMNVQMDALRDSMMLKVPETSAADTGFARKAPEARPAEAPKAPAPPEPDEAEAPEETAPAAARTTRSRGAATPPAAPPAPAAAVDPLQWWGALTKQFGELASAALREGAAAAARAPGAAAEPAKTSKSADAAPAKPRRRAAAKKRRTASRATRQPA